MNIDYKNKIQYVSFAISDTQQLIKNIDTKLTVMNGIIGSFIITYLSKIEEFICNYSNFSVLFWISFILFSISTFLCILLTTRIIVPTNNPVDNIKLNNKNKIKLRFFLAKNEYAKGYSYLFKNTNKSKLEISFDDYSILMKKSNDLDLLNSLIFEHFKLSYIRNIKNRRLVYLMVFVAITLLFFITSLLLFTIDTN